MADDRYRAHRAVKALLEALAAQHRLVLVLDDLHWSDDASLELIGALLRRGLDRPVLLALAYRPGQAPQRLLAALVGRRGHPAAARAAQRGRVGDAPRGGRGRREPGRGPVPQQRRQPVLPRAAACAPGPLPSPTRGAGERQRDPARGHRRAGRGAGGAGLRLAAADRRRGDHGRAVRARSRTGRGAARRRAPPSTRSTTCSSATSSGPTDVPRWFVLPAPARPADGLRDDPARAGGSRRTRAPPRSSGASARPRPIARGTSSSAPRPGDEEAIALLIAAGEQAAPRAPATAARWFEAALRLLQGRRSRAPGRRPRRARLGVALHGRARPQPRAAARGRRPPPRRRPRPPRRARRDVRRGRALARPPRGGARPADPRVGRAPRRRRPGGGGAAGRAGGRRAVPRGLRRGRGAGDEVAGDRAGARRRRADGGRCGGADAGGGGAGPRGRRGGAPRGGARGARAALRRGARAAPGGALQPVLGGELPRALRHGGRARRPRARHRARDRRGADDRAAHAGQGVPVRDAGAHGRDDRAVRDRARGGAARAQPALPLLGAVRARLGPLLRGRPGRRDRRLRGERRARAPHARRDDALDRRRPGLGARDRAARGRRARARGGAPLPGRRRGAGAHGAGRSAASTGRSSCVLELQRGDLAARRGARGRVRGRRGADRAPAARRRSRSAGARRCSSRRATTPRAAASARASAQDADAIGAGLQAAYSRLLLGQVLAAAGERDEAIAVLRAAERALDGFGSIRPRDEARRELRRARRTDRGARAGDACGAPASTR